MTWVGDFRLGFLSILSLVSFITSSKYYSVDFHRKILSSLSSGCNEDPLRCFLSTITIDIPDNCITLGLGVQVCLSSFVCQGLLSDTFSSRYIQPRGMSVDVIGLQTVCNGHYRFESTHGQVKATAKLSEIQAGLYVPQNASDLLPVGVQFNNCSVGTVHIDLSFTGGGYIDGFANEIAHILEDIVDKEIRRILCSEVSKFVTKNFTNIIQHNVDPPVRRIIKSQPASYGPLDDATIAQYVNLKEAIEKLQGLSWEGQHNDFGRCFKRSIFRSTFNSPITSSNAAGETPAADLDGTLTNLARSVISLLTNGTGNITFRMPIHQSSTTVPFSGGNLSVSVGEISLSGLNHLTSIDLSVPPGASNITVRAGAQIGRVGASIDVSLAFNEYSELARGTVKRSLRILLSLQELKVSLDLVLGISKARLGSLYLDQIRDLPKALCWLTAATDIFNISSIQLQVPDTGISVQTIDKGPPPPSTSSSSGYSLSMRGREDSHDREEREVDQTSHSSNEKSSNDPSNLTADLIDAIGNGLLVMAKGYGNLMPSLVAGLAQGPLRIELNRVAADYLNSFNGTAQCPPHENHHRNHTRIDLNRGGTTSDAAVNHGGTTSDAAAVTSSTSASSGGKVVSDEEELLVWSDSSISRLLQQLSAPLSQSTKTNVGLLHLAMDCLTNHSGALSVTIADKWTLAASGLKHSFNATLFKPVPLAMDRPYDLTSSVGLGHCRRANSLYDSSTAAALRAATAGATAVVAGGEVTAGEEEGDNSSHSHSYSGSSRCEPLVLSLTSSDGFGVTFSLFDVFLYADMTVQVSVSALADLQLKHLINDLNTNTPGDGDRAQTQKKDREQSQKKDMMMSLICLATSALRDVRMHTLGMSAARATLAVSGGVENNNQNQDVDVDISGIVDHIFSHAGDKVALEQVNEGVISKWLTSTENQCKGDILPPHHEDVVSDGLLGLDLDESILIGTGIAAAVVGFLISVYWYWYWNWSHDWEDEQRQSPQNKSQSSNTREEEHQCADQSDAEKGVLAPYGGGSSLEVSPAAARDPFVFQALVSHPSINPVVRAVVPIILIANLALFVLSNASTEAVSVLLHITAGNAHATLITADPASDADYDHNDRLHVPLLSATFPLFFFGLTSTVRDMWKADVKPLAILVALFSGVWPYAKLLCLFVCWLSPLSATMSSKRRGSVLMAVDAFGKWSLVDFFVMVLMMCAFYIDLDLLVPLKMNKNNSKGAGGYHNNKGTVDDVRAGVSVVVQPNYGFYLFLVATIVSIVMGHVVLACHRYVSKKSGRTGMPSLPSSMSIEPPATGAIVGAASSSSATQLPSLSNRVYFISSRILEEKYSSTAAGRVAPIGVDGKVAVRFSSFGRSLVIGSLLVAMLSLIVGSMLDTIMFEMSGLTGFLLGPQATVRYSMVGIGTKMAAAQADPAGVMFLQACFYVFGLVAPLMFLALALVLWLVPVTEGLLGWLHYAAEVLYAWAALDVFCVSIAAALLEIGQFASFAVGRKCNDLNAILAEAFDGPLHLRGNDKCFDVSAHLLPNSWLLFLSALLLLLVGPPTVYLSGEKHTQSHAQTQTHAQPRDRGHKSDPVSVSVSVVEPSAGTGTELAGAPSLLPLSLIFESDVKRPLLSESHLNDCSCGETTTAVPGGSLSCEILYTFTDGGARLPSETSLYKKVCMTFTRMAVHGLLAAGIIEICSSSSSVDNDQS